MMDGRQRWCVLWMRTDTLRGRYLKGHRPAFGVVRCPGCSADEDSSGFRACSTGGEAEFQGMFAGAGQPREYVKRGRKVG